VPQIVDACWKMGTALGCRNAFVCAAFLGDGLSAAEILRLKPEHIELPSGKLLTARQDEFLAQITIIALQKWLSVRRHRSGFIVEPVRERKSAKQAPAQLVYDIVKRGISLAQESAR
jgi:integrase